MNIMLKLRSMTIRINLDVEMAKNKISLTDLSQAVGISMTNLSLLKNGKVKGIRFNTLAALCAALGCQPGAILEYIDNAGTAEQSPTAVKQA